LKLNLISIISIKSLLIPFIYLVNFIYGCTHITCIENQHWLAQVIHMYLCHDFSDKALFCAWILVMLPDKALFCAWILVIIPCLTGVMFCHVHIKITCSPDFEYKDFKAFEVYLESYMHYLCYISWIRCFLYYGLWGSNIRTWKHLGFSGNINFCALIWFNFSVCVRPKRLHTWMRQFNW